MAYQLLIKRSAEKELDTLPKQMRVRITNKLLALEEDPRPAGIRKLRGENAYRIRIGDYRVLYTIDDDQEIVTIYAIGYRREVYR